MKYIILILIDFYRRFISPLFKSNCRFYPTCSTYAREVIMKFGFIKGTYLSVKRILKCNPFCKGGIDYPPEKFKI